MSDMIERAKKELELSGVDYDIYGDMTSKAVLELLEVFDKQGHSGASASLVSQLFVALVRGEALTPLTDNPDEWCEVGEGMWQNRRNSSAFSTDGGESYYLLSEVTRDREAGTKTVVYYTSKKVEDGSYYNRRRREYEASFNSEPVAEPDETDVS